MNLNKIVLVILLGASSAFGQDIGTTEVKVVEGFKPVIPGASRLNENATFADTIRKDRTQIYEMVDVYLNSDYKTRPLAAAQVKDDKIAGVGLDVYDKEPLPQDHKLRFLPNALLLPHIGYVTAENYSKFYLQMIENLEGCLENKPLRLIS